VLTREVQELRVLPSDDGARSVADLGLPVLVVSQLIL
jgi:D-tyrosyl-tRNA(Tyr) deacylase